MKAYLIIALTLLAIILSAIIFEVIKNQQEPNGLYEITYVVFYPQYMDTVTVQLKSDYPWEAHCNKGESYLWSYSGGYYLSTSAPIKIIEQRKVK